MTNNVCNVLWGAFILVAIGLVVANPGENAIYSLFLYAIAVFQMMPYLCGKEMSFPYAGTVLIPGKDSVIRTVLFVFYLFLFALSVSFMV